MVKEIDFCGLDSMTRFRWRDDLYERVHALGFKYVSEAVYDLYAKKKHSMRKTAETIGVVFNTVRIWLKKWGFERRTRGGNTQNQSLRISSTIRKIKASKNWMSAQATAEIYKCSSQTVRNIWAGVYYNE